jgi:hypothetical protein
VKKSAENCTLYHVVNKSVWADIGAANQYIGATCADSTTGIGDTMFVALPLKVVGNEN